MYLIPKPTIKPNKVVPLSGDLTKSQKLKMNPCGCSDEVLKDFNKYLANRFGYVYHYYTDNGVVFANPDVIGELM